MTKEQQLPKPEPQETPEDQATRAREAIRLYAAKNLIIQSYLRKGIEVDIFKRIRDRTPHHTFSALLMTHLKELDFVFNNDNFRFKTGDKRGSTDVLMCLLDMFFEWIDAQEKQIGDTENKRQTGDTPTTDSSEGVISNPRQDGPDV